MSYRAIASLAAAAILGIACISTEALAYRGGVRAGGARVAGVHGAYRGLRAPWRGRGRRCRRCRSGHWHGCVLPGLLRH